MPSHSARRKSKNRYSNHKSSTTNNDTNGNIIDDEKSISERMELQNIEYHTTQQTSSSMSMLLYRSSHKKEITSSTKSKRSSSLKRHKHKKKHKKKKRRHKSAKNKANWCIFLSFLISFIFLSIECAVVFRYLLHNKSPNRPPFLSYETYNPGEGMSNDINPEILYNFNYAEIYKFRDEMLANSNENNDINECDIVYKQNVKEIGDFDMNDMVENDVNNVINIDIHSNVYFNAYTHSKKLLKQDNGITNGYVLRDNNEFFVSFYLSIYSEYPLLYLICKNIFAFVLSITAILAPDIANKFFIVIFSFCSIVNSFFAFKNANIYLSFTRTAIPIYNRIIYGFYAPNSTKILLIIAFVQHCIASGLYLYKKPKKTRKRKRNKHICVSSIFYSLSLMCVIIFFLVLIPAGVDWSGYGVFQLSSSSFSLCLAAILLLLDHYQFWQKLHRKLDERKAKQNGENNEKNNSMIIYAKMPKKNGKNESGNVHRRRIKLMDGTAIKCQCDECKLRRNKRRKERKKLKLLK